MHDFSLLKKQRTLLTWPINSLRLLRMSSLSARRFVITCPRCTKESTYSNGLSPTEKVLTLPNERTVTSYSLHVHVHVRWKSESVHSFSFILIQLQFALLSVSHAKLVKSHSCYWDRCVHNSYVMAYRRSENQLPGFDSCFHSYDVGKNEHR